MDFLLFFIAFSVRELIESVLISIMISNSIAIPIQINNHKLILCLCYPLLLKML